jgi:O-antigen biosynthesis protein
MNGLIAAEHLARYQLAAQLATGREVLDAGCGVGYGAAILARAGASRVVGVDLAPEAVDTATEAAGDLAEFLIGDVQDLPFAEGSFDLVVCFEVLEHVREPHRALVQLKSVLRSDGVVIVSSPNPDVYPAGNPHHVHEFTPEELREALTAEFANVVLMGQRPWVASVIADDATLSAPGDAPVRAVVAKPSDGVDPETYTVALASDSLIEGPAATGVLADTAELRASSEAMDAAHESRQRLRTALDAEHESRQRLRTALDTTREDDVELRGILEASEEGQRKLRAALAAANDDRSRLRVTLEAKAAERDQFQRELRATERWLRGLEQSRSWRITRPMRAMGTLFRRLSQLRTGSSSRRI